MEYYIIGALILLLVIVLVFKMPNKAMKVFGGHVMNFLRSQESKIVQGVYNAIPKEIRLLVPSEYIAEIISYAIFYIGQLLKEDNRIEIKIKEEKI